MASSLRTVALVLGLIAVSTPLRAQSDPLKHDLNILGAARIETDGPGLVKFFKKRTVAEETRARVSSLIRQLGADEFDVRVKAMNDLVEVGAVARPQLSQAVKATDPEVRRRARWALEKIGSAASEASFLPAAARVLAARKPADAALVLLDYLPSVEEPEVAEEVARALAPVALDKDGKPEKAVLLALGDKYRIKRYAAADALIRVAGAEHRPMVHKLLADADVGLRRRVAVALLEAKDRAALPVLVKLLGADSGDDASAAEDALNLVAGDKAPVPPISDTPSARQRYLRAWEDWYKEIGAGLDLAKVDLSDVGRGFTLVALMGRTATNSHVQELDSNGRVRWTIAGLRYPVHVSKTRRDRVLICEYSLNRVTERDTKGYILWSKNVSSMVLAAERLKNGHTFIAARNGLMEVNKTGREVKMIKRPAQDLMAVERHKDGTFSVITSNGQYQKLDSDGRVTKAFHVGATFSGFGVRVDFLPSGGLVVPDYGRSRVREYDATGKLVVEFTTPRPNAVQKLSDNRYLVGSRQHTHIKTVDKTGKDVSTQTTNGQPLYFERR